MKFIDFFSGIGGFRLGMEMAGHECVGHCEIDKFADKSYRAMHDVKEGEWFANDITRVNPGELPEADCWYGGFPCQAFSIAGKRAGFEDMRGTLIFEVFRLAAERKPKILFLENVAGLLNHEGGRTYATILSGLWELGYDVQWQVLNSKNFGVPQNRERVFIIGHLRGTSSREVFPITGSSGETLKELTSKVTQGDRVYNPSGIARTLCAEGGGKGAKTGLYIISKDGKEKKKEYASCLTGGGHSGGNHSDMDLIVEPYKPDKNGNALCVDANYYKGILANQDRTGAIVQAVLTPDRSEKRQNGRRMKEPGEEMFTLTAQDKHGVMLRPVRTEYGKKIRKQYEAGEVKESRHNMTKLEPRNDDIANTLTSVQKDNLLLQQTRIRRLTPKECFRLQGFPDEYFNRAAAVNSDSQLYKQAGNSVTVNVIYEIARRL